MQSQSQIVSIIESAYLRFFGFAIHDEFDEELLEEVREKLQDSPQDYESIILGKLGATKKYKNFVEELKKLDQLKRIVGLSQLKPIHSLALQKVELGSHTNLIYVLPLNPNSEWNLQNIIVEIDQAEREMIRGLVQKSGNLGEFFLAIEDYFLDFSIRRLDISEIVACINRVALQTAGIQSQFKQTLTELTCADFVRLFARFFQQKAYFGLILHRLGVPLPFLFTSKTSQEEVQLIQTELLQSVMRQNDYCLITNIGSTRMAGKGKTSFLEKLFLLDHKFTSNSVSNLHQGSVDFYSRIPHSLGNRRILIADFHADYLRAKPHYRQLLRKCALHSTAIFIHANERELADGENSAFVKDYHGVLGDVLGRSKADVLVILRDCKKSDDETLIEKMLSFSCIRLPNLTDEQKKATINSKCSKLYNHLSSLDDPYRPKLDSSVFLSEQALVQFQHSKKQVENIMKTLLRLFESKNFYARMFPNLELQLQKLALKQKAVRCKNQINREIEQRKIFDEYNQINNQLKHISEEKPKPFSELVTETLGLLHERFAMTYLLSDALAAWRTKQTESFIKSIIAMNAEYDNMKRNQGKKAEDKEILKEAIKRAEVQLETYDISVDTIFSEVIAALQKEEGEKKRGEAEIIKRYYRQAYENITPINLIEGKTLEFGNPFLQEFIEQLSSFKYSYREVYVVSVVGAQSSAKSTILNYIFRCNFATSVGRCTKGVYLTIVQCDQKVVVVVDTEGLLSVAARDHTFDVQIACFVMLISDLVIINNKGEIDSVLRDLLGVCVYAIHELNSTENNANYRANSIIFTIRDQVQYGGTKQKQMLSQIIKSLNENSKIRYSDYINFTDKDIYPLQSAFVSQNEGIFCLEGANNSFGKSVLSLRSRILNSLQTPKNRSLMQFYANSKRRWEAIQNCGENIFNFKSIYEIKTKECIKQILETMKKQHVRRINNNQEEIVSCFHGKQVSRQADIEQELKMNYYKYKQSMLEEFHRTCQERVNEQDYISDFYFEIEEFCTICYKDFIAKFRKRVLDIRFKEETTGFKKSIRDTLKLAYTNGKKDKQILQELEQHAARLQKDMKVEMQNLEERQSLMGQNELSLHISSHVEGFLKAFYLESKISYLNLETLKRQYKKMQLLKSRRSKELLDMFKCGGEILMDDKYQSVVKEIRGIIIAFLNESESSVNALIKFEFNADIEAINPLMLKIMEELNQVYEIFLQSMEKYILKGQVPKFGKQHRAVILSRIISTFPLKFEKTYYEMSRTNLEKKYHQRQQAVFQLTAEVQVSLKIRGNMLETARLWIKKILNRQLARYFEFSQQIIQRQLQEICNVLNPRDIIHIGLQQSFKTSGIRSKERWINCFKLIKNINRYLKEILFKQPDYKDLDNKLINARRDANAKINKFIREKLVDEVESSARCKMENSTCQGLNNEVKNVDYYERLFGIDLATYKNDQSEQRLEEILISMWGCVEEMKKDASKVNEYCRFAEIQLDQQALKLRNEVNQFIKEKIEPIVVGCQARCPGCGMKCFKTGGHIDGHSLLKNSHIMECFVGRVYAEDQIRSSDMCFTEENIFQKYMELENGRRVPLIEWIQQKHPDWHDHFMDRKIYEKKTRAKQCNLIWANIEYVIIRYKYPYMLPDKSIWKYKYEQLDEDDILANHLNDY